MNKKTLKQWLKDLMHKEYRLAVWTERGTLHNFTGETIKEVAEYANFANPNWRRNTWTLYKSGRFFLPEREIERSVQ